jgi:hypothetical protein
VGVRKEIAAAYLSLILLALQCYLHFVQIPPASAEGLSKASCGHSGEYSERHSFLGSDSLEELSEALRRQPR